MDTDILQMRNWRLTEENSDRLGFHPGSQVKSASWMQSQVCKLHVAPLPEGMWVVLTGDSEVRQNKEDKAAPLTWRTSGEGQWQTERRAVLRDQEQRRISMTHGGEEGSG